MLVTVDVLTEPGNGLEGTEGTDTLVASLCNLLDSSKEGAIESDAGGVLGGNKLGLGFAPDNGETGV